MKTIIRIGDVKPDLAPFATAMVAKAAAKLGPLPEALLVVEKAEGGKEVYITVGDNPPEMMAGDRMVYAVFAPPESQEPIATFFDEGTAEDWAGEHTEGYELRKIESTDRVGIRACVGVVVRRNGGSEALYCRLKRTGEWTIPEAPLQIGETAQSAALRATAQVGTMIDHVKIPARAPYINVYVADVGHFLMLLLVADVEAPSPDIYTITSIEHPIFDAVQWAQAADPPTPKFVTVTAIQRVMATSTPSGTPAAG